LARAGNRTGRRDCHGAARREICGAAGQRWSEANGARASVRELLGNQTARGESRAAGRVGKGASRSPALVGGKGAAGLSEPWRGTKPMEGEGAQSRATGAARNGPDSGARSRSRGSSHSGSVSTRSGCGGATAGRQRPWRHGTAAVGGTSSRGAKRAAGGPVVQRGRSSSDAGRGGREGINAANPFWHRVAIHSGPTCGVNRRGGEKPRGRNATAQLVAVRPKEAATSPGVDTRGTCRKRGTQRSKPTRGRLVEGTSETASGDSASGASGRSDDEAKAMRDARVTDFSDPPTGQRMRRP